MLQKKHFHGFYRSSVDRPTQWNERYLFQCKYHLNVYVSVFLIKVIHIQKQDKPIFHTLQKIKYYAFNHMCSRLPILMTLSPITVLYCCYTCHQKLESLIRRWMAAIAYNYYILILVSMKFYNTKFSYTLLTYIRAYSNYS